MLFKAPGVELEHCDKYPHPQGRAVSQRKAKQISGGFFLVIVKDRTKKYTVLNTRVHSFFYIRTSNFGAEAERSYFFHDLRLKMFLRRS